MARSKNQLFLMHTALAIASVPFQTTHNSCDATHVAFPHCARWVLSLVECRRWQDVTSKWCGDKVGCAASKLEQRIFVLMVRVG